MRSLIRRAAVAAGAAVVVLGTGAGVAAAAPAPALVWSPSSFDFGILTTPGDTSVQVFKLSNTGGAGSSALTITVPRSSGYSTSHDRCTGTSLGPHMSCTVTVTFTAPATPGSYPGNLTATAVLPHVGATASLTGQSGKATPAIGTTPQPGLALVGTAVADKATVTGGDSPSGTVTFNLYNNSGCTGPAVFTDTENLTGGGATSASFTTTATGTDYWQAIYNGDGNNNSVTSTCGEPVAVSYCLIADTTSLQTFANLQSAVSAATAGDKLIIEGDCLGFTTIGKSLTLTGQAAGDFTTATLDGVRAGTVLTISSGVLVTLNKLTITHGENATGEGGGVFNDGTLLMNNSTITDSSATDGGGIYNDGQLNIGGGTIGGSSSGNTANDGGGIYNAKNGTVEVGAGTTVSDNGAIDGGGIYNASDGILNLDNFATIGGNSNGNTATDEGGGIFNNGTLNQSGATITYNSAGSTLGDGGGILEGCNSTNNGVAWPASDPNVTQNTPDNVAIGNC